MTAEAHSMSEDTYGFNASMVWSDDPESMYFRSMLSQHKYVPGNTSLVGDSTINEIIGDESTLPTLERPDRDENTIGNSIPSNSEESFRQLWSDRRGFAAPPRENQQMGQRAVGRPLFSPTSALSPNQAPQHHQPSSPLNVDGEAVEMQGHNPDEFDAENQYPGLIFVTSGQSLAIRTTDGETRTEKGRDNSRSLDTTRTDRTRQRQTLARSLAVLLMVLLIIAAVLSLALMTINKNPKAASEQQQISAPNQSPDIDIPPALSPSNQFSPSPTDRPSSSPTQHTNMPSATPSQAPTANPTTTPSFSPTQQTSAPSAKPTQTPTALPTADPTMNPSESPISEPAVISQFPPEEQPITSPTTSPVSVIVPTENPTPSTRPPSEAPAAASIAAIDSTNSPTFYTPTTSPSAFNPSVTSNSTDNALEPMLEEVLLISPQSSEALADSNSPQYQALEWLVSDAGNARKLDENATSLFPVQRWVMATFYFSTDGPSWLNSSMWLTSSHECDWYSVNCNNLLEITSLDIRSNNLMGTLPPEIGLLTSLEDLWLNDNQLNGTLSANLGQLAYLQRFSLTDNQFTGIIPDELNGLTNVRFLSLARNDFGGSIPSILGGLSFLKTIDFGNNNLYGTIPTELGNLNQLEFLSLRENHLHGELPIEISQLSILRTLSVYQNDLVGSVPPLICSLGIENLRADCEEVFCPCCTKCCFDGSGCFPNVTPSHPSTFPSDQPSQQPSIVLEEMIGATTSSSTPSQSPTATPSVSASPTGCSAEIATDKYCYLSGEDIIVTFENCNPEPDDWIGVYPAATNVDVLGDPIEWVWSCGNKICNQIVNSGTATFYNARGRGEFQVFLVRRNIGGPYTAYGIGNIFTMATTCI